jgi:hypothetical protein
VVLCQLHRRAELLSTQRNAQVGRNGPKTATMRAAPCGLRSNDRQSLPVDLKEAEINSADYARAN